MKKFLLIQSYADLRGYSYPDDNNDNKICRIMIIEDEDLKVYYIRYKKHIYELNQKQYESIKKHINNNDSFRYLTKKDFLIKHNLEEFLI